MAGPRERTIPSLAASLAQVADPRQSRGRRHPLAAMLTLACVALLCGRQTVLGIAEWANDYGLGYLKRLGFTHAKPPGQAT